MSEVVENGIGFGIPLHSTPSKRSGICCVVESTPGVVFKGRDPQHTGGQVSEIWLDERVWIYSGLPFERSVIELTVAILLVGLLHQLHQRHRALLNRDLV